MKKMPMALCKLEEIVGEGKVAFVKDENDCYYFRTIQGKYVMVTKEEGEVFYEEGDSADKRWVFKGRFSWDGVWEG